MKSKRLEILGISSFLFHALSLGDVSVRMDLNAILTPMTPKFIPLAQTYS